MTEAVLDENAAAPWPRSKGKGDKKAWKLHAVSILGRQRRGRRAQAEEDRPRSRRRASCLRPTRARPSAPSKATVTDARTAAARTSWSGQMSKRP